MITLCSETSCLFSIIQRLCPQTMSSCICFFCYLKTACSIREPYKHCHHPDLFFSLLFVLTQVFELRETQVNIIRLYYAILHAQFEKSALWCAFQRNPAKFCIPKLYSNTTVTHKLLCYAMLLKTTTETTPLFYFQCTTLVKNILYTSRGQNEQGACLVWYQPLEALKPVECLPFFSVHGKVSNVNAGEENNI